MMDDYINMETLRDELASLSVTVTGLRVGKGVLYEYIKQYIESVLRVVDEQATADVAQVRCGYWVIEERVEHPTPYVTHKYNAYYCSECGRRLIGYSSPKDAPYCHCGAKMDGGDCDAQTMAEL